MPAELLPLLTAFALISHVLTTTRRVWRFSL